METKHPRALLALLFVGVLMGALDLAIIGPALPAIEAEFGMNARQLSVLFSAYVLFNVVGTPLLAKLADRIGARIVYILCISLFGLGSLIIVNATEQAGLYFGRAVQGFGAGGIFPVAAAVIGTVLPKEKRGPALGLIGIVFGLAFLLGPLLGSLLLRYAWQWLFLINLPIAAVLIGGALRLLPTARATQPRPFDFGGAATLGLALTALVVALSSFDGSAVSASLRSPFVVPGLLVFALAAWQFWRIEKRAPDPILRPAFFESRQIFTACLLALGVGAIQAASVFYPALAVAALDVSQSEAALLVLPGVLASTVASPVVGKLLNTVGTRAIIFSSLMLVYVGVMLYGLTDLRVWIFIGAGIVGGIGMAGLIGAPLRFTVLNEAAPRDRGSAQGLLNVFFSIGRLLGAALIGSVAAWQGGGAHGYQAAFIAMGVPAAVMVLVATRLKSRGAELDG